MAELLKIESYVEQFKSALLRRYSQAEENRLKENRAAILIQSWFRACRVRAYLSYLHKKAVIIQKIWRGFTARAHFRQMVKEAYFIMKMNFYEEMAVRIQRRWKGFFVRKYVHNFYARKRYLEGVVMNNEHVRRELDVHEELQKRERGCLKMAKEQAAKVYQAHRLHHLLSTKQRPGIFNSPFRPAPHEMEQLLRQVRYQRTTRLPSRDRACVLGMLSPTAPSVPGTLESPWIKTNGSCCPSRSILPPIASNKQQGLLRELGEVREQHVKCPDLTLHLQTSFTHLEEAQNQLRRHDSSKFYTEKIQTGRKLHCQSISGNAFSEPVYAKKFKL